MDEMSFCGAIENELEEMVKYASKTRIKFEKIKFNRYAVNNLIGWIILQYFNRYAIKQKRISEKNLKHQNNGKHSE